MDGPGLHLKLSPKIARRTAATEDPSEGHTGRLIQTQSCQGSLRSLYLHPTCNMRPMESSAKRGHVPVEPSSVSHDPEVDYPIHRCERICKCGAAHLPKGGH